MATNMNMNMNMALAGGGVALGGVPSELGLRALTLDFSPDPTGDYPPPHQDLIAPIPRVYCDDLWDPSLRALLVIPEFLSKVTDSRTNKPEPIWKTLDTGEEFRRYLAWQQDDRFIAKEVTALRDMMENYRERYMPEIVDQQANFVVPWVSLLGIDSSHRWCITLILAALRIGEIVAMHYKLKYNRPRPSHVCPGLLPPYGPPGHSSFPSGHALQAHLVALCLNELTKRPSGDGQGEAMFPYQAQLEWLADRFTVNRERAGLHYRSDSDAGRYLADRCWEIIEGTIAARTSNPGPDTFEYLWNAAVAEWRGRHPQEHRAAASSRQLAET